MDIWEADRLILFIAFVIPGFICLKTYDAISLAAPRDSSQQLIDAVAYSCINYALLAFPILSIENDGLSGSSPRLYYFFWTIFLFVVPIALACSLWKLRTWQYFQKSLPHPVGKPWDYVFSQRIPYWTIVTLKDGKQIAGRFGSKSFASSSPHPEQIYLQEAWVLNKDGGFERPREDSAGVVVLGSEIVVVEFFSIIERSDHDRQEEASARELSASGAEGVPARKAKSRPNANAR